MMPVEAARFVNTTNNPTYATSHTGNHGLKFFSGAFYVIRSAAGSTLDLSVWCIPYDGSKPGRVSLYMADAGLVTLRYIQATRTWDLYVGAASVASGTVATTATAWQHLELRADIGASGTFATRIDGVDDIDYSGSLIPTASDEIERVGLVALGDYASWDDFVFGEGGWPGDLRIDPLAVTADSGTPEWTPSTGSDNYACVDDVPPSADYVYTDVDARDLYTLADWDDTDGGGNVIKDPIAVTTWVQTRKEDGTRDDTVRFLQSDGATEVQSAYTSLLTSYQNLHHLRVVQPGGGAWDKAAIDSLLVGIEADIV